MVNLDPMSLASKLKLFPKKQANGKRANRDILEDCNKLAFVRANRL
jgi:hypothetical protein